MILRDLFVMELIRPVAVLLRRLIGLLVMLFLGFLLYACVTGGPDAVAPREPVVFHGRAT